MTAHDIDTFTAHLRRSTRGLNERHGVRNQVDALERIIESAVAAVPGAHTAGLTLTDDHYLAIAEDTDFPVTGKLDALQRELGTGPATMVLAEPPADGVVVAADFAGEAGERWPEFAAHALEAGHRSMISVLLEVDGKPKAALNLYSDRSDAFDEQARRAAAMVGMTAAMLLLAAEHVAQLRHALDSRDVIGRAKGILMERFGLDQNGAFAKLREASQETNVKLHDVATWLAEESDALGGPAESTDTRASATGDTADVVSSPPVLRAV
ncbi:GAF and ANTAR domain-containing protein [Actinomycetospora flava]|uniref:ANTAR domain-containing protein n=1 Tax=Actinomycetospora flava TaxID=3129232 RepID=A0ABU8MD57_9PSEU